MTTPQILKAERSLKRERKRSSLNDKTSTKDRTHLSSIPEASAGNHPDSVWSEWECGWTGGGAGNRCGEAIIAPPSAREHHTRNHTWEKQNLSGQRWQAAFPSSCSPSCSNTSFLGFYWRYQPLVSHTDRIGVICPRWCIDAGTEQKCCISRSESRSRVESQGIFIVWEPVRRQTASVLFPPGRSFPVTINKSSTG